MKKETFVEKIGEIEGFLRLGESEKQEIVDCGLDGKQAEFSRLTEETFVYEAGKPCLEVCHALVKTHDAVYDLVYFRDLSKVSSKTPKTYMVGFNDRALSTVVSMMEDKTMAEMFDHFVTAYQDQSDEEFIDMPIPELSKILQTQKSGFLGVTVPMPNYSEFKGSSNEVISQIKDIQGRVLLPALGGVIDAVLHANAFCDNVVNRSARLIGNAMAEIGMIDEQSVSYGLKAAKGKLYEIQMRGSKLAGLAGMF